MAEHENKTGIRQRDIEHMRLKKRQGSLSSPEMDTGRLSLKETPYCPHMEEHAATLTSIPLAVQRHEYIMRLNNTYGLQYVQRLVESVNAQAKLTVSSPGDIYEQEADRVAEEVTRKIKAQRKAPEEEEELQAQEDEEELQAKPLLQRQEDEEELLQSKTVQRQVPEEEEELAQGQFIQRQAPEEEEELQTQPNDGTTATVANDIETRINSARGAGHPMSEDVRQPMEKAFGADFTGVRTHADKEADTLNRELSARAFTTGQDIFFRDGEYSPGSESGKKLLAHELTHVVQQTKRLEQIQTMLDEDQIKNVAMSVVRDKARDLHGIKPSVLRMLVKMKLSYLHKNAYDDADVKSVIDEVNNYITGLGNYTDYYKVIEDLGKHSGEAGVKYTQQLKSIVWLPLPRKKSEAPSIVFGPTPSKGFYQATTNTIQVDLSKHESGENEIDNNLAILDTILYESLNGVQIREIEADMQKFNEYNTDIAYINKLKTIYETDLAGLCQILGAADYMDKTDENTCVEQGYVPMPDREELDLQSARQALWFWKTSGWNEEKRMHIYDATEHAPNMPSTTEVNTAKYT